MTNIKRNLRVVSVVLSFALVFLLMSPLTVNIHAEEYDLQASEEQTELPEVEPIEMPESVKAKLIEAGEDPSNYTAYGIVGEDYSNTALYPSRSSLVAKILITIGGIVVGYIIDGIVIAETGKSTGEWVADAYRWVKGGIADLVNKLIASITKILYGVDSNGCVQKRPGGVILCPY